MQQHLSAEAQSTVYLLSGAVTTSILNMNLSALRCHHNSPNFHWWSVKQSDKATEGVRVSYRFDPDPTCIFMWWHTPTREAMNVWTGRLSSCMYCICVLWVSQLQAASLSVNREPGMWWEMRVSGWMLLPWWGRWWLGRYSRGTAPRIWPSSPSCRRGVHLFHNTSGTAMRCTHNTWKKEERKRFMSSWAIN